MKTFLNKNKIPVIPPIFRKNKSLIDFKQKAEIFDSHFSKQYTLKYQQNSIRISNKSLSSITFEDK